jgi:hypothetical protein
MPYGGMFEDKSLSSMLENKSISLISSSTDAA